MIKIDKNVEYNILDMMRVIKQIAALRTEENKQKVNNILGILTKKEKSGVRLEV